MKISDAITKKSFVRTTVVFFLAAGGILVALFWLANLALSDFYNNRFWVFPVNVDITDYDKELEAERYDSLTVERLGGTNYIVFDETGEVVYTTETQLAEEYTLDDEVFITDVEDDRSWSIAESDDAGERRYYITLYSYDLMDEEEEDDGGSVLRAKDTPVYIDQHYLGSCVLDEEYNILGEQDLFPGRTSLSRRELRLLLGEAGENGETQVWKYKFTTKDKQTRTMFLFSPVAWTVRMTQPRGWLIVVGFFLLAVLVVLLLAYLLQRRLKRWLAPLNEAIADYGAGKRPGLVESDLAEEFRPAAANFSKLVKKLDEADAEKEEVYRERQRMIADVSHDLRTPLTVIQGYSQAFLEERVPEDKRAEYLQTIHEKAVQSSDMINMIFDYTRLDHPAYTPDIRTVNLTEVTTDYLAAKEGDLSFFGDTLVAALPEEDVIYPCDIRLLYRLYDNLIGNAIKHNEKGTTVFFALEERKFDLRITIADDGKGIPEEIKHEMFTPFVTGNAARTSGEGTGLGMHIARKIVDLHGGSLRLVDPAEDGYATEFEIIFHKN